MDHRSFRPESSLSPSPLSSHYPASLVSWRPSELTAAGEITTRTHVIRPVIWFGFGITSLAFGLWYAFFNANVTIATQSGLLSLCSFGVGFAISTPMLVIQAAMPLEDMAAATSAWVLVRSFGATIGE